MNSTARPVVVAHLPAGARDIDGLADAGLCAGSNVFCFSDALQVRIAELKHESTDSACAQIGG